MSLTIVLSGPKSAATQARTALASRGLTLTDNTYNYGLGKHEDEPYEFIHALGDDIDAAHDAVSPLGYRLTIHYETPEETPPSTEAHLLATLAEYERRIAALEAQAPLPPIRGGAVESPGWANQNATYGAEQTRRAIGSLLGRSGTPGSILGGLVNLTDCQITPPGSGMSVNVGQGEVWVPGTIGATQSGYYCEVSSSGSLVIAASNPSNPRIDTVSALVTDKAYFGSTDTFALAVETGTPTAGATLTNLSGAATPPDNSLTLGYVLVPATATNIVGTDISNVAAQVALGQFPGMAWGRGGLVSPYTLSGAGSWVTIPLTELIHGTLFNNAWDPVNHWFLVQETGFYHVSAGFATTTAPAGNMFGQALINATVLNPPQDVTNGGNFNYSDMCYCVVGDKLSLQAFSSSGTPAVNAFMAVRRVG